MKNILILGLALFMGISLSSCDDDDDNVRPMGITPAGTMNFGNDHPDFQDDGINFNEDDEFLLPDDVNLADPTGE